MRSGQRRAALQREADGAAGRVAQGDVIGYCGNRGHSTGPHLHYEVRRYGDPVDPVNLGGE
jgi:murein DD-endopeptidase MepM/ murein hydrolase activator NlpD